MFSSFVAAARKYRAHRVAAKMAPLLPEAGIHALMIRFEDFQNPEKLVLIAGPCVIESEEHVHRMADAISAIAAEHGFPYVFKASYDKANRTSLKGYRGPGLTEGLRILGGLKQRGYSILTDIHETGQMGRRRKWWISFRSRRSFAARPICSSKPGAPGALSM